MIFTLEEPPSVSVSFLLPQRDFSHFCLSGDVQNQHECTCSVSRTTEGEDKDSNEQPLKISFETAGFVVVTLQLASKDLRTFWRDENCRVQKELKRVQKSRLALTLTL